MAQAPIDPAPDAAPNLEEHTKLVIEKANHSIEAIALSLSKDHGVNRSALPSWPRVLDAAIRLSFHIGVMRGTMPDVEVEAAQRDAEKALKTLEAECDNELLLIANSEGHKKRPRR
jgi:hypothetical protein